MKRVDQTLPTPAENLACDEALLDWAESEDPEWEFLRVWESPQPLVVLGRSSRTVAEVCTQTCEQRKIPILRRSSGGAAIVAGPGCLMYSLVLSYQLRPELRDIRHAHAQVLSRIARSLTSALAGIGTASQAGTSDLVFEPTASPIDPQAMPIARKFSGNSLRAKRSHFLYHGTLLYNFDLRLIDDCLLMPPRQPEYRRQRPHGDFLINLPISRHHLVDAVHHAWPTQSLIEELPTARIAGLVAERFSQPRWNLEFP